MSEASKAAALAHAIMIHGGAANPEEVLETAQRFHEFISGADASPPAKATKAVVKKALAKAAAQPAEEAEDETVEGPTKEEVGEGIQAMLNANLRKEAIALFKKYKAESMGSVNPKDFAALKSDIDDALLSA
jgi:hypothetical protein